MTGSNTRGPISRYAAFLRGINLGARRVTNEQLRSHAESLGFEDVATFRASGNLIVATARDRAPAEVAERLRAGLTRELGYEVPVFLRSAAEVLEIAGREPFDPDQVAASAGKLQVALLVERPSAAARRKALALATDRDRLAIEGRELYWLPSGGISESDLDLNAIGAELGPTTIRTKGTIDQIAAKHFS